MEALVIVVPERRAEAVVEALSREFPEPAEFRTEPSTVSGHVQIHYSGPTLALNVVYKWAEGYRTAVSLQTEEKYAALGTVDERFVSPHD